MTTKKRMTKHQLKEDQFVTGVFRFQEWAEENLTSILIGAGVVVVIIAAAWYFSGQSSRSEQAAIELLGRADMQARSGQTQLAVIDYQKLLDDHSGTEYARVAALKLANVYFNSNDYANANAAFQQVIDKYAKSDIARFSAMRGLATTAAAQGEFQQAAQSYWDLAQRDTLSGFENDYLSKTITYALKSQDSALAQQAFARLEEIGSASEEYRLAKILMIENGHLTYQEGEYR